MKIRIAKAVSPIKLGSQVRFTGKLLQSVSLLALLLFVAGCGGLNVGRSFSPIDFLLPGAGGLLKAEPPPARPDSDQPNPAEKQVILVAQI